MSSRWFLGVEKGKLKKGPWTFEEDIRLLRYIRLHGDGRWSALAKAAGLQRCGKSCRLRWVNYLRPGIKRGNITPEEEQLIMELHARLGNRWSLIAERIPGRTDNEIKNYWRSHLKKKLQNPDQAQPCQPTNTGHVIHGDCHVPSSNKFLAGNIIDSFPSQDKNAVVQMRSESSFVGTVEDNRINDGDILMPPMFHPFYSEISLQNESDGFQAVSSAQSELYLSTLMEASESDSGLELGLDLWNMYPIPAMELVESTFQFQYTGPVNENLSTLRDANIC